MTTRTAPQAPTAEQLEQARADLRRALATDPVFRRMVRAATRRTTPAVTAAHARRVELIAGRSTRLEV